MHIGTFVALAVINGVIFGWLGAWVATQKNREPLEGAVLGVLFSLVGVFLEAMMPTRVID